MFAGIAFVEAKPGEKGAAIAAARDHAEALRRQPGCVAAYVLDERGTERELSISVFESEEAFRRAADATRPVILAHHLERLVTRAPEFHLYDVR